MSRVVDSAAHARAQDRLVATRGSIYAAFDALGCGIDRDQAVEYLGDSATLQDLPEDVAARVIGVCMAFAMVAVESDRIER